MSGIKFIQAKKHKNFRYIPMLVEVRLYNMKFLEISFHLLQSVIGWFDTFNSIVHFEEICEASKRSFYNGILYKRAVGVNGIISMLNFCSILLFKKLVHLIHMKANFSLLLSNGNLKV